MKLFARIKAWAGRIKRDVIAVYFAARDPRTPAHVKILAFAVAAFALSPLDLIPDFIPVLGYIDDLLLLPVGIWVVVHLLPAEVLVQSRARAEAATVSPRSRMAAVVIVGLWGDVEVDSKERRLVRSHWIFLIAFTLVFYGTGAAFIEGFANYSSWHLIGTDEFVAYHGFRWRETYRLTMD